MQDFKELNVWRKAHELTLAVYRTTKAFPKEELYGLVSQVRRAAASIPANLAEGRARGSDRDFARFVRIALGSSAELEYHLLLARELGYFSPAEHEQLDGLVSEVRRMLISLSRTLSGGPEDP